MDYTYIVVIVTAADKDEAEKIANHLLNKKLIACANIISPVSSLFHWSGKTEKSDEYLLLMKSRLDLFGELSELARSLHSYEVPEIIALPIAKASTAYVEWLNSCLKPVKK